MLYLPTMFVGLAWDVVVTLRLSLVFVEFAVSLEIVEELLPNLQATPHMSSRPKIAGARSCFIAHLLEFSCCDERRVYRPNCTILSTTCAVSIVACRANVTLKFS